MTDAAHPELDLTAHCDCGAVTLTARGRVISMFLCACHNCQTISGGGHSSPVLLPAEAVSVTGETKSFARPADSGATFTRHFCPACGTTVYAESSRAPTIRILQAGLFAGQNAWFRPNQVIFARTHQDWDLVPGHLPQHERYRESRQA